MISGGYILQPRKLDESDVFRMPPVTRELWLYILRKVCYKDNRALKRGQGYFRFSQIQKDLSWHVGYRIETYSKPQLTKSLRRLREGNMIETTKATHGILVTVLKFGYCQNPASYEGNDEGNAKETEGSQYTKEGIKKEEEKKEYIVEIVDYLNEKTGKSFRSNTKKTQGLISARLNEGFSVEDFRKVIDTKTKQWKDDPEKEEYLRPETLFGTKFESYLNKQGNQAPGELKLVS